MSIEWGNVWVTDGRGENGKGHTVTKFSPDGKALMTLGHPGPSRRCSGQRLILLLTSSQRPNGDIFVADGHGVMQGHPDQ